MYTVVLLYSRNLGLVVEREQSIPASSLCSAALSCVVIILVLPVSQSTELMGILRNLKSEFRMYALWS